METDYRKSKPLWPAALLFVTVVAFAWFMAANFLTIEDAKAFAFSFTAFAASHPFVTGVALVFMHAFGMAFSMPVKAVFTVLTGALLGPVAGVPVTLAGVLAGTTFLFFATKRLFREKAVERFGKTARRLERRLKKHPVLVVAGLRLVITLPYGPITLVAALVGIKYVHFLFGSLLGDIPVVVLYCTAGERLLAMANESEAISPLTVIVLAAAGITILATSVFGGKMKTDN